MAGLWGYWDGENWDLWYLTHSIRRGGGLWNGWGTCHFWRVGTKFD